MTGRLPGSRRRRLVTVRHAPTATAGLCVGNAEAACTISSPEAADRMMAVAHASSPIAVWTSPSRRCRGPADIVADRLRVPLCVDDRLQEISLGEWQMRSWSSIEAADPDRYRSWLDRWMTQAPPGGELPGELLDRVRQWWEGLPDGSHLLVSHAGVTRALRVLVGGRSWLDAMATAVLHLEPETFGDEEVELSGPP